MIQVFARTWNEKNLFLDFFLFLSNNERGWKRECYSKNDEENSFHSFVMCADGANVKLFIFIVWFPITKRATQGKDIIIMFHFDNGMRFNYKYLFNFKIQTETDSLVFRGICSFVVELWFFRHQQIRIAEKYERNKKEIRSLLLLPSYMIVIIIIIVNINNGSTK